MGKTIFMVACLAGEGFLVYCLSQYVLELRRGRRLAGARAADLPNWLGPSPVVPFTKKRPGTREISPAPAAASLSPASGFSISSIEVRRRA
jgi:hypothetical protein